MSKQRFHTLPSYFDDILAQREQCLFLSPTTPYDAPENLHFHKQLELGLCLSGHGIFYIHNEIYPFGPGDISLIYPGESHIAQSARTAPSDWQFLTVDIEALLGSWQDFGALRTLAEQYGAGRILSGTENKQVAPYLRRLISLYYEDARTYGEKLGQYAALIACILYESAVWMHAAEREGEPRYPDGLRELYPAVQYILNRYSEDVQTSQLCECCNLSPVHLRRKFAALMGVSPIAFLHKIRISHACSALSSTEFSVLSVAQQCGYSSLSSFNRQFQKWMHCSPSEYRTAHRREK